MHLVGNGRTLQNASYRLLDVFDTRKRLANSAVIHRTYISDLERGSCSPIITVIDKIAVFFHVSRVNLSTAEQNQATAAE